MALPLKPLLLVITLTYSFIVFPEEKLKKQTLTDHQVWLKERFSEQHNELIPKVAVADMLFACNKANDQTYGKESLNTLITEVDKTQLAEKLSSCLDEAPVNSEQAINYGLLGCFEDQLKTLSDNDKREKMALVKQSLAKLPLDEKKQSFIQCVTEQSISYLK